MEYSDNIIGRCVDTDPQQENITMGFLDVFARPSPEKLEKKGDALFEAEQWGLAKLEYDHALELLEKRADPDPDALNRIIEKLASVTKALAHEHLQNAEELIAGGFWDEAQDLLSLALELSAEGDFRQVVERQIRHISDRRPEEKNMDPGQTDLIGRPAGDHNSPTPARNVPEEEYFIALCGTLPVDIGDTYLEYGENFKAGYVALNRGEFKTAEHYLALALDEHPEPGSYIALELAATYANLGRSAEAQHLLKDVLRVHPDALPAYQLLCDIYWEQGAFRQVDALLDSVPAEFSESLAIVLLKGETLRRSGSVEAARTYYQGFLETYGWNAEVAQKLAEAHEILGDPSDARALYREMMETCASCRARVDPEIKHKYAELSFEEGIYNSEVLELYLSLAREIPENAAAYFDRISHIYSSQGNMDEALRFRGFSERAKTEPNHRS